MKNKSITIKNPMHAPNAKIKTAKELSKYCRLISCFGVLAKRYLDSVVVEKPSFKEKYEDFRILADQMSAMYDGEGEHDAIYGSRLDVIESLIDSIEDYLETRRENDAFKLLLLISANHYIFEVICPHLAFASCMDIVKGCKRMTEALPNNWIAKKKKALIMEEGRADIRKSKRLYSEHLGLFRKSDTLGKDKSIVAFIENRMI